MTARPEDRTALDDLPALDAPCLDCHGTGVARGEHDGAPSGCDECGCTGHVLTDAGRAVLDLLRRHRDRA